MTVTVGKKTINLGWEVAVTIVFGLAVSFWKFGAISNDFLRNQDDIKKELVDIKVGVNLKNKRDSIQDANIDTLKNGLATVNTKYNNLKKSFDELSSKKRTGYYTQRYDDNRHLHETSVPKP